MSEDEATKRLDGLWNDIVEVVVHWCPLTKFADLHPNKSDKLAGVWPEFIIEGLKARMEGRKARKPTLENLKDFETLKDVCLALAVSEGQPSTQVSESFDDDNIRNLLVSYVREVDDHLTDPGVPKLSRVERAIGTNWEAILGLPSPCKPCQLSLGLWIPTSCASLPKLPEVWCYEINIRKCYRKEQLKGLPAFLGALQTFGQKMTQHSVYFETVESESANHRRLAWFHERDKIALTAGQTNPRGWGFLDHPENQPFRLAGGIPLVSWRLGSLGRKSWSEQLFKINERMRDLIGEQVDPIAGLFNEALINASCGGLGASFVGHDGNDKILEIHNADNAAFLFAPLFCNKNNDTPVQANQLLPMLFGVKKFQIPASEQFDIELKNSPQLLYLCRHSPIVREALAAWASPNGSTLGACCDNRDWVKDQDHRPWPPGPNVPVWLDKFFKG